MDDRDDTQAQTRPDPGRSSEIARVIEQVRSARSEGERLDDAFIISAHPELMPELGHELEKLKRIETAWAATAQAPVAAQAAPLGPAEVELARALAADLERPTIEVPGYTVLREIGRGGQAVVFLAIKLNPRRRVALKVMRDGSLADDRSLARFQLEVELLAKLNHPNIVNIFETGQTAEGSRYLTMNYVAGCGLAEYMQRRQERAPDDPSRLLRLFFRICDVVNAAHQQRIVHRDLKPGNIRVDERGEPHVLDFGLARSTLVPASGGEPISVTGEFLGSLPWSSPEQAGGDPAKIDIRTDVYSLGVILYQMLTGGRFPYEVVGNVRDVLNNIVSSEPTPPSKVMTSAPAKEAGIPRELAKTHPAVNEEIERIVLKALAKRPEDRYQNAGELGRAIADYLLGRNAPGLPSSGPKQQVKTTPARFNRRIIAAAAIALAGICIIWEVLPLEGDRMKPSRLLKAIALSFASTTLAAGPAPRPVPAPARRAPLAEHLARAEASVRAVARHITIAAEHKGGKAADARLVERARKLSRHHDREPWLWADYLRRVPGVVVVDTTTYQPDVAQQEAETAAAALGDDLDALWARHKQVQAERMVLWSKIAFRAIADQELSNQPLYRFELKAETGKTPGDQQMSALKAVAQFVRIVDHLANETQDAVESDPPAVFVQWHTLLAAARTSLQDKLLSQGTLAMDVYKPATEAGQLAAQAKQLVDDAQTIVDAERALAAADTAQDDEEADASRAQLQQALADTVGAVAALDGSVGRAARAWGIGVVPGTKAAVGDLPDLKTANAPAQWSISPGKWTRRWTIKSREPGADTKIQTYTVFEGGARVKAFSWDLPFVRERNGSLSIEGTHFFQTFSKTNDEISVREWAKRADYDAQEEPLSIGVFQPIVLDRVADTAAGSRKIDLLKLFPDHHRVLSGKWEANAEGIQCLKGGRLLFDYSPPEEYDLQVEFVRRSGNDVVAPICPLPQGGSVAWFAGGW